MQRPKLITVSGPTAIGKTSFAVELSKLLGCPILSSDARQFYKEMEIGTWAFQLLHPKVRSLLAKTSFQAF